MGFFDLVKGTPPKQMIVNIDTSLGNVLVAGNSPRGTVEVIRDYGIDAVNSGGGVIVIRDCQAKFSAYPNIVASGSMVYEINNEDGAVTSSVDVLSNLSDSECNQYIINMFDKYSEIDRSRRMNYQNYIATLRNLLKKRGRQLKFSDLGQYTIEEVETLNATLNMTDAERNRNDRFLNSIRPDIANLEAYFNDFSENSIGEILSGNKTMEKILASKEVIEISLDFTMRPKESEIIMCSILDNIHKFNLALARRPSVTVIVTEVPNEIMQSSGLNRLIKAKNKCNVLYTVADIAALTEKSNEWVEDADSMFLFQQTSNKNKEYCSELFGTYEKDVVTTSNPSFLDAIQGKGVRTRSTTKQKERVYLPDVFAKLPENQAIYRMKSGDHTLLTVYKP